MHRMDAQEEGRKRSNNKRQLHLASVNLTALTCVTFEHNLHHLKCLSTLVI